MTTAELIIRLKGVTASELRGELAVCEQARADYLRETDREIALIRGLIEVVDPRSNDKCCTQAIEVTREEFIESNPASVLGTLSDAICHKQQAVPDVAPVKAQRPATKRIARKASPPSASAVQIYLEVMGRTASGPIAKQFQCNREEVDDILESDQRFQQDSRGFWDLKARVEARKELELRPIEQVH